MRTKLWMKFGGSLSLLAFSFLFVICLPKTTSGIMKPFKNVIGMRNIQVTIGRFDGT